MRATFEQLGGAYIKFGQFIASTPSMFPRRLCDEFQNCLDDVQVLPFNVIERILQRELPQPISECFAEIDPQPLGSASIAQVHAARLHCGTPVVIKVQKPGVEIALRTDLQCVKWVARIAGLFFPLVRRASIPAIATDMRQTFIDECNFLLEAERINEFRQFLEQKSVKIVMAPRVYEQWTTPSVLVMEQINGSPLKHPEQLRNDLVDPLMSLKMAMNVWLMSLTECDFFHADIHGGNLLLLKDGRIGFIDFGIVGSIDPSSWDSVMALVESLSRFDARATAAALSDLDATSKDVEIDILTKELNQVFQQALRNQAIGSDEYSTQLMAEFSKVCLCHDIHLPRQHFLLLRQYLCFDRYLRAR